MAPSSQTRNVWRRRCASFRAWTMWAARAGPELRAAAASAWRARKSWQVMRSTCMRKSVEPFGMTESPNRVRPGARPVSSMSPTLILENGVPILAQPPLARLLHKVVPEGREIPSNVYHAVAEVLAYVFRLRAGRSLRK